MFRRLPFIAVAACLAAPVAAQDAQAQDILAEAQGVADRVDLFD